MGQRLHIIVIIMCCAEKYCQVTAALYHYLHYIFVTHWNHKGNWQKD